MIKKLLEFVENKEKESLNKLIDYTKVGDDLNTDKIKEICKDAEENNFYSVCTLPEHVSVANSFLNDVKIISLIDFPKGTSNVKKKIKDIDETLINGANEIDVVINYKLVKNQEEHEELSDEIRTLSEYCHREGVTIKVIIEIGALSLQEIDIICKMCIDGNVDFIMTSTGKLPNDNSYNTKLDKVKFMRKILPDEIKIKFSGGVRTTEQLIELKEYVDRIGTSIIPK